MNFFIAPSILSANFANLGSDVNDVLNAGADFIHFDVMDNHYVPNLSFGADICKSLRKYGIKSIIDVHLMASPVTDLIQSFSDAGANIITIHPEASTHLDRDISLIKSLGLKAGIAFNPATPLNYLDHVLDKIDLILIMSVNPGFGGQDFIENSLEKISKVRSILKENNREDIIIQVDGGVKISNLDKIVRAGANSFVMGSAIFLSDSYKHTIDKCREIIKVNKLCH